MTAVSFDILGRDKASPAFDKVSRSAERTEKKFGFLAARSHGLTAGMTAGFGKIVGAMGAVAAVSVFKGFIDEARESRKVAALTESIIRSTGGAAKISAKQVGALATSISNKSGVDDEAIQSGANLLLTFKNVRNEVGKGAKIFDRATAAAVDLSAAGFGDVAGASKMLGKALNDPLKGLTALGKAGVTFTEDQKKQIKTLVETGHVLEAQKIILKEVESQVGGAAAAAADPMEKLGVIIGNVKETIGTAFLPIVDKAATWLGKVLPVAVDKAGRFFSQNLLPPLKAVAGFARDKVIPVVGDVVSAFAGLGKKIVKAIGPVDLGAIADDLFRDASKWATDLIEGVKTGVKTGDWKSLGTAIGNGLIAAVKGIGDVGGTILDTIGNLIDKVPWSKLGTNISNALLGVLDVIDWKSFGNSVGDALIAIVTKSTELAAKAAEAFKTLIDHIDWAKLGHDSTNSLAKFISGVDWLKLGWAVIQGLFKMINIPKKIFATLAVAVGKFAWGIGKALVEGIWSGIVWAMKGAAQWLYDHVVLPIKNLVRFHFGIRSPSTVFAEIGRQLIAGLLSGMLTAMRGIGGWINRNVISPVIAPFARAGVWLVQKGKNLVAGFKGGISAVARGIGGWVSSISISPILAAFSRAGSWLVQHGKNLIAGFKAGAAAIGAGIGRWAYDHFISPVVAPFSKAGTWLNSAGRNVIAGFKNGMVAIWGQVTAWVGGIATWIKDHKGPVSLDGRLLIPAGKAIMSGFLKGLKSGAGPAWSFVSKVGGKTKEAVAAAAGWIKGFGWPDIGSTSLGTVGKGVERWRGVALQALKLTGSPSSWINSLLRRMNQESGGNPFAINLTDINARRGDPSRGLMQTIMATFNAYKRSGVPSSSIYSPLENIIASINYANARYGAAPRGWDRAGGYKLGTPWVPNDQLALLHKGEAVIPAAVNRNIRPMAGGGAVRIEIAAGDGSPYSEFLVRELRKFIRVNGGDVQVVLGR